MFTIIMKRLELFLMVLQVPVDYLMLILAGLSAYALRFTDWAIAWRPVIFEITAGDFMSVTSVVGFAWLLIFAAAGLYTADPNRKLSRDLFRVLLACSTGLAAVAVYVMFTQQLFDSRFLVAAGWGFAVLYVSAGRIFMRGVKGILYRFGIGLRTVVIIGAERIAKVIEETFEARRELGYRSAGVFSHFNDTIQKKIIDAQPDELIYTNPRAHEKEALRVIDFCNERHITFKYSADLFATYSTNMEVSALAGVPIIELKRTALEGWGRVVKRLFDVVFSVVVISITSPIMLVAALIIFLETGTPVIYRNERVGKYGQTFFTLKFRSMHQKDSIGPQFPDSAKAEQKEQELIKKQNSKTGPVYKIANDPRVTTFGRFIRRWSIDELPQFFNVLKGEMSIVGPRPHQPREVNQYEKHHKSVLTIKPGVTGLAQISGRSDLTFEEEVRLDALYIEQWSLWQDMIIFLKTPFILFKKRKVV